jgi:hypothetical protein
VFLDEASRRRKRKRDILVGTWNVSEMDLQEVGCGSMDWIKLTQEMDR